MVNRFDSTAMTWHVSTLTFKKIQYGRDNTQLLNWRSNNKCSLCSPPRWMKFWSCVVGCKVLNRYNIQQHQQLTVLLFSFAMHEILVVRWDAKFNRYNIQHNIFSHHRVRIWCTTTAAAAAVGAGNHHIGMAWTPFLNHQYHHTLNWRHEYA